MKYKLTICPDCGNITDIEEVEKTEIIKGRCRFHQLEKFEKQGTLAKSEIRELDMRRKILDRARDLVVLARSRYITDKESLAKKQTLDKCMSLEKDAVLKSIEKLKEKSK